MKKFGAIGLLILTFTTTNSSAYDRHHKLAEEDDCSISDSYKVVEIGEKIYQEKRSIQIAKNLSENNYQHQYSESESDLRTGILGASSNLLGGAIGPFGGGIVGLAFNSGAGAFDYDNSSFDLMEDEYNLNDNFSYTDKTTITGADNYYIEYEPCFN